MKYLNFKKVVFATLLLTSTANAYFDQDSLKSWSESDLKHTGLKLADKVLSNTGNRDYNFFKLAVLSQEEARRGMNPTYAANPEDKLTFGVYEYLATKANMNSKVFEAFFTFFDEKAFTPSGFNLFIEKTGIQAKTAPTPRDTKLKANIEESKVNLRPMFDDSEFQDPRENYLSTKYGTSNGKTTEPAFLSDDILEDVFKTPQNESMEDTTTTATVSPMEIESSIENGRRSGSNSPKSEISQSTQEETMSVVSKNPTSKTIVDRREEYLKENGWSMDPAYIADHYLKGRLVQEYGEETTERLLNGPVQSVSMEENTNINNNVATELEVTTEPSNRTLLKGLSKDRPQQKKRPPTLKREKKGETTQETPVVTTPMEVEAEKIQKETVDIATSVEKKITPLLPIERDGVPPQVEKKADLVSPKEDAPSPEKEEKLRKLSKVGGLNMMGGMGGFNPADLKKGLKKTTLSQKPNEQTEKK